MAAASVWYRAGTITISTGSKTVTGDGTKWSDNKVGIGPGQMLLVPGAGTVQMYEIVSVDSDTQITLNDAWTGTAVSAGKYAIPIGLIGLKETLVLSSIARLGYYQAQMDGWQEIMTGDGDITLEAPDGTEVTISSFKKLTADVADKADKLDLDKKADKADLDSYAKLSGASFSGVLDANAGFNVKGGTYLDGPMAFSTAANAATTRSNLGVGYGNTAGTVAQGNDSRLNTIDGKAGGNINGDVNAGVVTPSNPATGTQYPAGLLRSMFSTGAYTGVESVFHTLVTPGTGTESIIALRISAGGTYIRWRFGQNGNATAPGTWVNTSDRRLKTNIKTIENPLDKMRIIRGYTWDRLDGVGPGVGFIAQEAAAVFPDNVFVSGDRTLDDGTVVKNVLSPDTSGISAALHHEAILALMDRVEKQDEVIAELQARMKAIDGLES